MDKQKLILYSIIAALLIVVFSMRNCSGKTTETITVKTPEKVGKIDSPIAIVKGVIKHDTIYYKGKTIITENPINKKLVDAYTSQNDSLKRLQLYVDSIEEREQTQTFDNKDIKVDVWTKVRGTLLDQKIFYKVKSQEIKVEVPKKETVFAIYAGGGISDNALLNNFSAQAEIGLQLKSGDIISAGYDTQKNISIKYTKQIFNYKK